MDISEKIRMLRKEKGLTQAMLAESLDVARSTVIAWEGNRCLPEGENLKSIARVLDTTVAFLLGESAAPAPVPALSERGDGRVQGAASIILKLSEARYMLETLDEESDASDVHIIDELVSSCKKISWRLLSEKKNSTLIE
ncbi:MAG: helix-turn-helix transcriptional regulator [Synergistaceae bacterium]|nr:helix-turn-helix transcriptional regulator [Synergistaceae bacterium]